MSARPDPGRPGSAWRLAAPACFAALLAACAPLLDVFAPRVPGEWATLVDDIRAFERRIGFVPTGNFVELAEERGSVPFCGQASRFVLPYSYQDPAIQWRDFATARECRRAAEGADIWFGRVEALGEVGAQLTPEMVSSKLDRFLYVVIHEDCHDQFDLPYGVEEALCNLLTYKAMAAFSDERFGAAGRADRAIRRYASVESERTRATIHHYDEMALLYARYERGEVSGDALLKERTHILARAARDLAWKRGALNAIGLASDMTYSRHYPFLESVHEALGRDLARTVAFFKRADRSKPSRAEVMNARGLATEDGVDFIRAYEAAVVGAIARLLAAEQARK